MQVKTNKDLFFVKKFKRDFIFHNFKLRIVRPRKIYVCSPLKGDVEKNMEKARQYSLYVASLGHVPMTPHMYFPLIFGDSDNREKCLKLAIEWLLQCDELWFFGDVISEGMRNEIEVAKQLGITVVKIPIERGSDEQVPL